MHVLSHWNLTLLKCYFGWRCICPPSPVAHKELTPVFDSMTPLSYSACSYVKTSKQFRPQKHFDKINRAPKNFDQKVFITIIF